MKNQQHVQFTLRVKGTIHQYMQTGPSEEEARKAVARFHLIKFGRDPKSPSFQAEWEELYSDGLILVYKR